MAPLKALALVLGLAAASPPHADPIARWHPFIAEAAARFSIPATWIEQVMRAESGGRTTLGGGPIVSPAGAIGLMQVMPQTWAELRGPLHLGTDPRDPHDNIIAGAAYLAAMHRRFGYPGLFGAYNAGPGRYAEHLVTGRALPAETRAYLAGVVDPAPPATRKRLADQLFFALRAVEQAAPEAPGRAPETRLFVPLTAPSETGR